MLTVGVDLAAQAGDTAIAVVEWSGARLREVAMPGDDRAVVAARVRSWRSVRRPR